MSQTERHAELLQNRLARRYRHLSRQFRRAGVGAFRAYDWDIPEVRATVDVYVPEAGEPHLVVAEYERDQTDTPDYLPALGQAAATAVGVPIENVHLRRRRTRPGQGERYTALADRGVRLIVPEQGLRFRVDLDARLDVGLFADHRGTRAQVRAEAQGRRVLNLFCYTAAFSVYAAAGGAVSTTSVDASAPSLALARENFALNQLRGELVHDEVGPFLRHARKRWDLVVLDPPSYSDREGGFDVLRDHPALLELALSVLEPGGILWFSTNHQRFAPRFEAEEQTERLRQPDFRGTPHRSWRFVKA